jgi:TolB-like protein/Flp pilus assembly protein TadD
LPVVIDDTSDRDEKVPDRFRDVQWTRLPGGQSAEAFVERVRRLLTDSPAPEQNSAPAPRTAGLAGATHAPARSRTGVALGVGAVVLAAGVAGYLYLKSRAPAPTAGTAAPSAVTVPAAFSPPPHSVAVLPFVNMSGDPKQEYFSDGLSEELLNSLVTIRDLQVAARTSSFYFKGEKIDLQEVAHKLNVGAILEGSVRRDGNHVRITAQLINTLTGFHLWSQTYDRDLKNVLALQTEIATAVTHALQATLVPDAAANIELGGTQNPQAFDAFLRGERLTGQIDAASVGARIAAYEEATRLDPNFAKAYAGKSLALQDYWGYIATTDEHPDYERRLVDAAQKAVSLAPDLARGHVALALHLLWTYHFEQARQEIARALDLATGDALVLAESAIIDAMLGFADTAIANARRSVSLDPLNAHAYDALGWAYDSKRQYRQAIEAYQRALGLDSKMGNLTAFIGLSYIELGDLDSAVRSCAMPPLNINNNVCLAIAYRRQGHPNEAQDEVSKLEKTAGDAAAAQFVEIYAQWGDIPKALDWLDTAYRLRDPGLAIIKSNASFDPLRKEPRFQAIERKLNFPN